MATLPRIAPLLLVGACQVGPDSGLEPCTDCQVVEPLGAQPLSVASCVRSQMQIVCQWADEESLVSAPLTSLQAAMSFWTAVDERVTPSLNEGGQVIYDLEGTAWEDGRDVEFRIQITADWASSPTVVSDESYIVGMDELEAGYQVASALEVWDIGLIADDPRQASIAYHGAIEIAPEVKVIDWPPVVARILVNPAEGVEVFADGEVAVTADKPGYYRFTADGPVVFDPDPTSYERL